MREVDGESGDGGDWLIYRNTYFVFTEKTISIQTNALQPFELHDSPTTSLISLTDHLRHLPHLTNVHNSPIMGHPFRPVPCTRRA